MYYVYMYYDPIRKEPIYIGKGKDTRFKQHFRASKMAKNGPFSNRIKWMKDQGKEPIIIFLKKNVSENCALQTEIKFIKQLGRKDLKIGPLLNLTHGGEGSSGYKHSVFSKDKMKNRIPWNKGIKRTPEEKQKISQSLKGRKSPNTRNWVITFPSGEVQQIFNLSKFCRDHQLNHSNLLTHGKDKKFLCARL